MERRSRVDVLIVGAGPTGLTAAAELSRLGISVRVIDKNLARTDKSKALGIQAGVLEALDATLGEGLSQRLISAGRPAKDLFLHLYGRNPIQINLSSIPSAYDFVLILPQSETERILEERLSRKGVHVERGLELGSFECKSDEIISTLKRADGASSEVTSTYLIGADGAHSTVRRSLGIPFQGGQYVADFVLGDIELEWPWEYGPVRTFVSGGGFLAGFPIDGQRKYRLVMAQSQAAPDADQTISLEEFSRIVSKLSQDKVLVRNPAWLTRFRVHHRITQTFQKGPVFLAGDAAHIHSPAGGQGMNAGIMDALNLSAKLARVLKGEARPGLLERYTQERMPVIRRIVKGTDIVTRLGLLSESPLKKFVGSSVLPHLARSRWLQQRMLAAVSQVESARKEIESLRR